MKRSHIIDVIKSQERLALANELFDLIGLYIGCPPHLRQT